MTPALDDYRWLIADEATPWLARAATELAAAGGQVTVALTNRLRKDLSPERVHLLLEQLDLRQRAREKFSQAERMFFTRKGLEQATDEAIAVYKSARFPSGDDEVYDCCCGIGGDLIALVQGRSCTGTDIDPVCQLLAQENIKAYGDQLSTVLGLPAEALIHLIYSPVVWHIDPDRRHLGKRTTSLEIFEPSLNVLQQLLAIHPSGAIKIAPASDVPSEWNQSAEREWIGSRGECRQQVVWHGDLALHPGRRSATVVDGRSGVRTVVGLPQDELPLAAGLGRYLYEPHAAVLAARLSGELCREHSLAAVSTGVAYLTGDSLIADDALDGFEVLDVLPLDQKQLRAYCRERGIGKLEIKKRGVEIEPEKLRRQICADGEAAATILLAPMDGAAKAIVARRI